MVFKKQHIIKDRKAFGVSLLFMILLYPYPVWGILSNSLYASVIGFLLALVLYFNKERLTNEKLKLVVLYEFTCVIYLLLNLTIHGMSLGGIMIRLPLLLYFGAFFVDFNIMKKIINYLITIILIVSIVGLFFFIFLQLGVHIPSMGTIVHYNESDARLYTIYPFLLVPNTADIREIIRFYGVFDEPGVLGTISVFFLYYLKFNFKDWRSWGLTIVGIFTFSFFFFGMLFINLISRSIAEKKGLLLGLMVVTLIGLSYNYTKDNSAIYTLVWERFEYEDGGFKGDHRMSDEGEEAFEKIKGTKSYWLGLEPRERERYWEDAIGGSSYKNVVAKNGMVFFSLYVAIFLLLGWYYKKTRRSYLLYVILVLMCLYQRTNIYSLPYMFLYACAARTDEFVKVSLPLKNKKVLTDF